MYLLPVYRGYGEKIFFNKAHLFYHVFTSSLQGYAEKIFLIKLIYFSYIYFPL